MEPQIYDVVVYWNQSCITYLPDQNMSSDLSIELSLQEKHHPLNNSLFMEEEEDLDDDEELPSFLQQDNKSELTIKLRKKCVYVSYIYPICALIYLVSRAFVNLKGTFCVVQTEEISLLACSGKLSSLCTLWILWSL